MGTSSTERVALLFETRADLSGSEAVRKDVTAIGQAATKATQEIAAAAQAGAAAEKSLAGATATAAAEQGKLVATIEQTREAWAKSGGDMDAFKRQLAAIVGAQQQLAAATRQAGEEMAKQAGIAARATSQYRSPIGPGFAAVAGPQALGPGGPGPQISGPQLGPAVPGLTTAAAIEASNRAIDQISPKARQAGNAINVLAQAAATGHGSLAGLATAVGNVAQGISVLTDNAKVAASAAGIGAVAAAVGLLIGLAVEAKRALDAIPVGKLSDAATGHLKNLHTERDVQQQLALLEARRADLQSKLLSYGGLFGGNKALDNQKTTLQAIADVDAQSLALANRRIEITAEERQRTLAGIAVETAAQTTAVGRYQAKLREFDAERVAAIRAHTLTENAANQQAADRRHDLDKEGTDFLLELSAQRAAAEIAVTQRVYDIRRRTEDIAYQKEKKALQDRSLSAESYKTALDDINARHQFAIDLIDKERALTQAAAAASLLEGSESLYDNVQGKLAAIELAKDAQIKAGVTEVTAVATAEQKKRQLYLETARIVAQSLKSVQDITANSNNERTKAINNFVKNLRAIELGYEAVKATISSLREGAEAIAAAARGDFVGAAMHGSAAIKFAAVAAVAGNEAGGGGGGSGGGAGGGSAANTTFQPREGSGGGGQTIVLQTVNPYSREIIGEAVYQLDRYGKLKRPIPIAPTSGLAGAA